MARRSVLTRDRWEAHRRHDIEIEIDGLDRCLPFFGAVEGERLLP